MRSTFWCIAGGGKNTTSRGGGGMVLGLIYRPQLHVLVFKNQASILYLDNVNKLFLTVVVHVQKRWPGLCELEYTGNKCEM